MPDRLRLFVAVVLRGQLAARVDGLRLGLGSAEVGRLPPHITLVPPFNTSEDDLDPLLGRLRHLAERSTPFSCVLGPVAQFPRALPVTYLAVDDAAGALHALAAAARAVASPRSEQRDREGFVPHVTVANRLSPDVADAAVLALGHFQAPIEIVGFSVLARDPEAAEHRWQEIADVVLGAPLVRGRGGIEVVLSRSRTLDPVAAARAGRNPTGRVGEPWAITARIDDRLVGAAEGDDVGHHVRVTTLWVDPAHRGIGVASRILEAVERAAAGQGAERVEVIAPSEDERRYLEGRGFAASAGGDRGASLYKELDAPT